MGHAWNLNPARLPISTLEIWRNCRRDSRFVVIIGFFGAGKETRTLMGHPTGT